MPSSYAVSSSTSRTATTRPTADAIREALTTRFKEKTQAEWSAIFDGTDACVAAIIPLSEAHEHPHLAARGTFVESNGITQPAPAPRFSRTEATIAMPPGGAGRAHPRGPRPRGASHDVDALIESGAAVQA